MYRRRVCGGINPPFSLILLAPGMVDLGQEHP